MLAPDDRMLRQFAALWIAFFAAVAVAQEFYHHRHVLALVLGILAGDCRADRARLAPRNQTYLRRLDGARLPNRVDHFPDYTGHRVLSDFQPSCIALPHNRSGRTRTEAATKFGELLESKTKTKRQIRVFTSVLIQARQ